MKRMLLLALIFGFALLLVVSCSQAATAPTEEHQIDEETIEAPPVEAETEDVPETEAATTEALPTEAPSEAVEENATEAADEQDEIEVLIVDRCSGCHSVDRVFNAVKTEDGWETTIDRMISLGAEVSDEEKAQMIDWLVSHNQ